MQTNYLAATVSSAETVTVKNEPFHLSESAQNKLVDAVILQGGGIGLGILLAFVGAVMLANWLGFKEAIAKWTEKQQFESETLKSISDALGTLLKQNSEHNSKFTEASQTTLNQIKQVDLKLDNLHEDIKEIRGDIKDLSRPKSR